MTSLGRKVGRHRYSGLPSDSTDVGSSVTALVLSGDLAWLVYMPNYGAEGRWRVTPLACCLKALYL